ncbi:hypothetical protein PMAYCL1PPCAC_00829 [Pristionchus mayeri]|uniref:MATH domain-containing protein n=1 Tax=Pristionchus mayeri TaxID=1317129 RepID=A0AAN5C6D9_9BILA|nr:hypothetical protein PMAYCL1PPCAC_00829 [Pristionchus mayeri]
MRSMLERILIGDSGVLCARFTQISKLSDAKVRSPPVTVAGKEWVISIFARSTPHINCTAKYLCVFLELMNAGNQRQKVSFTIKLIRENGRANIDERANAYFDASHTLWGDTYYMAFPVSFCHHSMVDFGTWVV